MEAPLPAIDSGSGEPHGARRLHPLTMVQRMIVSLPGLFFILLPVLRGGDSMAWFNLIIAAMYLVFIVPWITLHYLRFRYWITPEELIIHSGVLTRRSRNIPVDRIQNIEIEQAPLQRLLGTAKVQVYTAGSARAEGSLEYVSVSDAREVRELVRQMQRQLDAAPLVEQPADEPAPEQTTAPENVLIRMDTRRVLLAGAFRFSLLYIAVMFSFLQYIEPDPELLFSWLMRGPLEPLQAQAEASPALAAVAGILGAILFGWLTGIVVTLNRWHRFTLQRNGDKLHRAHGLLTLKEGTIPLSRVQAYLILTNPVMEFFGWYRLELQTMGINVNESGYQVAVPFARMPEIEAVLTAIGIETLPSMWRRVSPLTMRRFMARTLVLLGLLVGLGQIWFDWAWWLVASLPLFLLWSWWRYRAMQWAESEGWVALRSGVIRRSRWMVPVGKIQTAGWEATWFQRRLSLASIVIDTAGASAVRASMLPDVEQDVVERLIGRTYARFRALGQPSAAGSASAADMP